MRTAAKLLCLALVALLGAALSAAPARADSIDPGETLRATLDDDDLSDDYPFEADAGDVVTIILFDEDDDDEFFPYVALYSPDDFFLISRTDPRASVIHSLRLREDGRYTIVVQRAGFFVREDFDYVLSFVSSGSPNDGGVIGYAMPPGVGHLGVFVDRIDALNELDETNNYAFVRNVTFGATGTPARSAAIRSGSSSGARATAAWRSTNSSPTRSWSRAWAPARCIISR